MDINTQIREGVRLLTGIEDGNLPAADCYNIMDELDEVLVHLVVKYLRKKYPATRAESAGIMGRLVEITGTYPQLVAKIKKGEEDPISEWFEETYSFGEYFQNPDDFIDLVVNKLEG